MGWWFGRKSAPADARPFVPAWLSTNSQEVGFARSYSEQFEEVYRRNPVGQRSVRLVAGMLGGLTIDAADGDARAAGAAVVAFTVTNSAIAATDTVNLNLTSGNATAGSYRYWVEGIAAGSFKVVIENRSGAALGEALVFAFAVVKAVNA